MTVQELIDKLTELPPELRRATRIRVETTDGGKAEPTEIRAEIGDRKIWWEPDTVVISARY